MVPRKHESAPQLHMLLLLVVVLQLALLVGLLPLPRAAHAAPPPPFPPASVTSPYQDTPAESQPATDWLNIIGMPSVEGSMSMQPAIFGKMFAATATVNGAPAFVGEIVLPHEVDDVQGCTSLRPQNELNETLAGSVLLLRRGACAFGIKGESAVGVNASAVIIYGCPTTPPFNCPDGLVTMSGSQSISIPVVFIQAADGARLHDYLVSRREQRKALLTNDTTGAVPAGAPILEPISVQVPATGALDPTERAALVSIISSLSVSQDTSVTFGQTRPWTTGQLTDAALDPCLDRLAGLWCNDGHVTQFYLTFMEMSGTLNGTAFAALTALRVFAVSNNKLTGAIPPEFCTLTQLLVFDIASQNTGVLDGFTSLPSCLSQLTRLRSITVNNNAISGALPDWSSAVNLTTIDFSANLINLNLDDTWSQLTHLEVIIGSFNRLAALPSFKGMSSLRRVAFSGNAVQELPVGAFDGCSSLTSVDVSHNSIAGPLPLFGGCSALTSVFLSSNGFNGSIPTVWKDNMPSLVTLRAAHNAITSPVVVLNQLLLLATIDLSWNRITTSTGQASEEGNVGAVLSGVCGPSCATLNLAHNALDGEWLDGWLNPSTSLRELDLSYNAIQVIPPTLFLLTVISVNLHSNNISVWGPTVTPSSNFLFLDLQENSALRMNVLPQWITTSAQMLSNPGDAFACPQLSSTSSVLMKLLVDAAFSNYAGCSCAQGTFGSPPLCFRVPLKATIGANGQFTSSEVGNEFSSLVRLNANTTGQITAPAFSDNWYGSGRLTLGLQTHFVVNLNTSASVRYITLRIHINRAEFTADTDVLAVYEGDGSADGVIVAQLRGTDTLPSAPSAYTTTAAYQTQYADELAQLGSSPALWEVNVLGRVATVSFTSRAQSGTHFVATFTSDTQCPTEFYFVDATQRCVPCYASEGNFFDTSQQRCRPVLTIYTVSMGVRGAVFATSAAASALVAACVVLILWRWQSPVVRAASRSFLLLLLALLGAMALAASLYAAVPHTGEEEASGRLICHARVWLSAFPLTGILAVLLAKTNRVDSIFSSSKLQVRKVTDRDLLVYVSALLGLVTVALIAFSAAGLQYPLEAEGSGAQQNEIVSQCAAKSGWSAWLGVVIAYVAVLSFGAAWLAFRTRNLPSRFNESSHIANAIIVLIFFGVIIVPLASLQSSPDSAVLIQGVGQALLAILLTACVFGPKAYLLLMVTNQKNGVQDAAGTTLLRTMAGNESTATVCMSSTAADNGGARTRGPGAAVVPLGKHGSPKRDLNRPLQHVSSAARSPPQVATKYAAPPTTATGSQPAQSGPGGVVTPSSASRSAALASLGRADAPPLSPLPPPAVPVTVPSAPAAVHFIIVKRQLSAASGEEPAAAAVVAVHVDAAAHAAAASEVAPMPPGVVSSDA